MVPLADRHYNRRKVGSPQFAPPGRCLVLCTAEHDAFWITSYPYAEYAKHAWGGAWVCSAFRNESRHLSSELIREAVAATLAVWDAPPLGMITFVDSSKVRRKRDPGRCYLRAGFRHVGYTKGGLHAFQLLPHEMPDMRPALPSLGDDVSIQEKIAAAEARLKREQERIEALKRQAEEGPKRQRDRSEKQVQEILFLESQLRTAYGVGFSGLAEIVRKAKKEGVKPNSGITSQTNASATVEVLPPAPPAVEPSPITSPEPSPPMPVDADPIYDPDDEPPVPNPPEARQHHGDGDEPLPVEEGVTSGIAPTEDSDELPW